MESKLIVWSLNQLKIGLWEDMRLLFGNTEVQNHWKYTLQAESSPFCRLYFHSISMAVSGNRYDSHEKTWKYKRQDKKPQGKTMRARTPGLYIYIQKERERVHICYRNKYSQCLFATVGNTHRGYLLPQMRICYHKCVFVTTNAYLLP